MQGRIDHVNYLIPADGVDEAVRFYRDVLGLTPEKLEAYRDGDRTSFFMRVGPDAVLNLRPVADYAAPAQPGVDHICLALAVTIDEIRARLAEHDVSIDREGTPLGAHGRAPAVYVTDPFGHQLELKATNTE